MAPARLASGVSDASQPAPGGRKGFFRGTHRTVAPERTVERLTPLLPAFGITRVANVTGLDHVGLPVVMAVRPNSRSLSVSQGKGLTLAAAQASGLMESIELFHAERVSLPLKLLSTREIRTYHRIPNPWELSVTPGGPFQENLPILWTEGVDLLSDESVWIPHELVHMSCVRPYPPGFGSFAASSNGLASGNSIPEAVVHGICEVVERDALARAAVAAGGSTLPMRIALDSIEDPDCREVLALYEAANLQVAVWHQATQCGIPCFKAGIMDTRGQQTRSPRANYGAGCHPVRSIALVRALTEAAQSRLTVIAGSRDDLNRSRYEQTENPDVVRETRAAFAEPDSLADFDEIESFPAQTFSEDIDLLLGRLRATGSPSVIMVNLTLPGVDVAVVRIVIPGLSLTLPSH